MSSSRESILSQFISSERAQELNEVISKKRSELPIFKHRTALLNIIHKNQVSLSPLPNQFNNSN